MALSRESGAGWRVLLDDSRGSGNGWRELGDGRRELLDGWRVWGNGWRELGEEWRERRDERRILLPVRLLKGKGSLYARKRRQQCADYDILRMEIKPLGRRVGIDEAS